MTESCTNAYQYSAIPAGFYDRVYREGSQVRRFWHRYKFQCVSEMIPAGARSLLDVACGPGSLMSVARQTGLQRFGTDVAREQINYAAKEYGDSATRFCVSRLPDLPFFDESVDVVTLVEILEHLPAPEVRASLAEVFRLLRPGGTLILTTPNFRSLWPLLEVVVNRLGGISYAEQHISRFNPTSARQVIEEAGFAVTQVSSFFTVAPFATALSWRLGVKLHQWERRWVRGTGALILASATKPVTSRRVST
jgi:2-polyprenyl-3-methyl-5-hydroxy-6-metoxy-1,4-benzoquinol methylase